MRKIILYSTPTCPACMARRRLSSGKGRLRITCSPCGHKFNYAS